MAFVLFGVPVVVWLGFAVHRLGLSTGKLAISRLFVLLSVGLHLIGLLLILSRAQLLIVTREKWRRGRTCDLWLDYLCFGCHLARTTAQSGWSEAQRLC